MAFDCRIFGHEGIKQILIKQPRQFSGESVFVLDQPYIWAQLLVAGPAAVSLAPNNDKRVTIIRIEVPDGQAIRYEINPPNREGGAVAAFTGSPILQGKDNFYFGSGWSLSIIDATNFP